jgi:transcriptional regulator
MYVHPAFQIDRTASLRFAAERGFGIVVACERGAPLASPLPFCLSYANDGSPRLSFHVARGNPLGALAAQNGHWLVSVHGADTYVSPDWYASADQVPTWLYESVQLSGPVQVMAHDRLLEHLDELAAKFEAWLAPKPPWTSDKVSPARHKMLSKAIVGIEMSVEVVQGSFKLNQHKSEADQISVARALSARPDPSAQAISKAMTAARPQLVDA